ncbi:MAG: F0F1 ATP synthase subunit B [Clostridiales bacterium]|nr:F0F1 ATP synthase subunit B [Clostridiales bacterium]
MRVQELIEITPWTAVFSICNLLILCLIMKKLLFKPVQNVLEKRQQEIQQAYSAADAKLSDAESLKQEYTEKMNAARSEADTIVRSAADTARRRGDQIVSEAQAEATHIKQKAQTEIEQEKNKAFAQLQGELSGMAVDIASKLMGREVTAQDQDALVNDFLRNAGDDK